MELSDFLDVPDGKELKNLYLDGRITRNEWIKSKLKHNALDIYERNPILQNIPDDILAEPHRLYDYIEEHKDSLVAKKRLHNSTIIRALAASGKLKNELYSIALTAIENYQLNPSLKAIPKNVIKDRHQLLAYLFNHRNEFHSKKGKQLSLSSLLYALKIGGGHRQIANSLAYDGSKLEFFEKNKILHHIPDDILNNDYRLLSYLLKIKKDVVRIRGKKEVQLSYILKLFSLLNIIDIKREKVLTYIARSIDIYQQNPVLHNIPAEILNDELKLIYFIDDIRKQIKSPSKCIKGAESIEKIVQGISFFNHFSKKRKNTLLFAAGNLDFYNNNTLLHNIPETVYRDPLKLLSEAKKLRKKLVYNGNKYSLVTICSGIILGKRLPKKETISLRYKINSIEYFRKNPLLKNIESDIINDNYALAEYLIANRDRMTRPSYKKNSNCLTYIASALINKGIIPWARQKRLQIILGAADYFTRKKEMINEQLISALAARDIQHIEKKRLRRYIIKSIDRSKFTYLKDDSKMISDHYFIEIMNYAFYLYSFRQEHSTLQGLR